MRRLGGWVLAAVLGAICAPAMAGSVSITITNLRDNDGVVRVCITAVEDAFPRCNRDPDAQSITVAAADSVTVSFDNVEPGQYAVAVLHDENENGKADRVLGMAPREGFGFSRDAPVRMAPPKWEDAVFEHGTEGQNLTIRMRYLL